MPGPFTHLSLAHSARVEPLPINNFNLSNQASVNLCVLLKNLSTYSVALKEHYIYIYKYLKHEISNVW